MRSMRPVVAGAAGLLIVLSLAGQLLAASPQGRVAASGGPPASAASATAAPAQGGIAGIDYNCYSPGFPQASQPPSFDSITNHFTSDAEFGFFAIDSVQPADLPLGGHIGFVEWWGISLWLDEVAGGFVDSCWPSDSGTAFTIRFYADNGVPGDGVAGALLHQVTVTPDVFQAGVTGTWPIIHYFAELPLPGIDTTNVAWIGVQRQTGEDHTNGSPCVFLWSNQVDLYGNESRQIGANPAAAASDFPWCLSRMCQGDVSEDVFVDLEDLQLLMDMWGTPDGDIDGDGDTDVDDLAVLLANLDAFCPHDPTIFAGTPSLAPSAALYPTPATPNLPAGENWTLDLLGTTSAGDRWTCATAECTIEGEATFFEAAVSGDLPLFSLWQTFPALEWDCFYAMGDLSIGTSPLELAGTPVGMPQHRQATWLTAAPPMLSNGILARYTFTLTGDELGTALTLTPTPVIYATLEGAMYSEDGAHTAVPFSITVYADVAVGPPHDDCADAIHLPEGVHAFSNTDATTDGPVTNCDGFGDNQVGSDIWYTHTAMCDGLLRLDLCGSGYDTRIAVYGATCPAGIMDELTCNDDFDCDSSGNTGDDGFVSRVALDVTAGSFYHVRIGGYDAAQGTGTLSITTDCCPADLDESGDVNVDDLVALIVGWGQSGGLAEADINGDGVVNVDDLVDLIVAWGPCVPD